jgi:ABC-type uncharacterized transport system permease subunit
MSRIESSIASLSLAAACGCFLRIYFRGWWYRSSARAGFLMAAFLLFGVLSPSLVMVVLVVQAFPDAVSQSIKSGEQRRSSMIR